VDISAKRLDPADNLNAQKPQVVCLPITIPFPIRVRVVVKFHGLEWQTIIREQRCPNESFVCPSCTLPLWQLSSGGSRLMKASEIDGCVCSQYRNCHCL